MPKPALSNHHNQIQWFYQRKRHAMADVPTRLEGWFTRVFANPHARSVIDIAIKRFNVVQQRMLGFQMRRLVKLTCQRSLLVDWARNESTKSKCWAELCMPRLVADRPVRSLLRATYSGGSERPLKERIPRQLIRHNTLRPSPFCSSKMPMVSNTRLQAGSIALRSLAS